MIRLYRLYSNGLSRQSYHYLLLRWRHHRGCCLLDLSLRVTLPSSYWYELPSHQPTPTSQRQREAHEFDGAVCGLVQQAAVRAGLAVASLVDGAFHKA